MDYEKKYNNIVDTLQSLIANGKKLGHIIIRIEDIENAIPELKESEEGRNKTIVDSKSKGLSKGTGGVSGKNVRPLSSMTNIERQAWGLILTDELEEGPYSWLVRHNFLEDFNSGEGFCQLPAN